MKKLVYVHIPKTGGVSIRHALDEVRLRTLHFGMKDDKVTMAQVWKALDDKQTEVVTGHIYNDAVRGGVLTKVRRRTRVLATVIRHPVDRVYSLYRHALLHGGELRKYARNGLGAFVRANSPLVRNAQAWQLAGTRHSTPATLYASALVALNQFDLVGTTEGLSDFIYGPLSRAVEVQLRSFHENRGVVAKREPLTDDVRAFILSNNDVDMALWRYARTRMQ